MSLFHRHQFARIKSVRYLAPTISKISGLEVHGISVIDSMLDAMKPKTSVVKECECGVLKEFVFNGDHTKEFEDEKKQQENQASIA